MGRGRGRGFLAFGAWSAAFGRWSFGLFNAIARETLDELFGLRRGRECSLRITVHLLNRRLTGSLHDDLHRAVGRLLLGDVGSQFLVGALHTHAGRHPCTLLQRQTVA